MPQKVYFDLSSISQTSAGSSVYAWELCHRLMRLGKPLQVLPFTCSFRTVGKKGFPRLINGLLRDTIWQWFLAGREIDLNDYVIFPNAAMVPKKFYQRKYAVVVLDLGAWHNLSYVTARGKFSILSMRKAIENADCIYAISDYTAYDVAQEFKISQSKITVAPCGLSEVYKSKAIIPEKINGIPLDTRYFLHVGTFEPKKNLPFLLKVYERFREIASDDGELVKLILTGGESWNSSNFTDQIKKSPYAKDIIVLGKVNAEDLPGLYRGATALVFPSIFEGFGLPVIEALSQGTPVLVNANSSLTQFGNFGATVMKNFDLDIWANQLKEILNTNQKIDDCYVEKVIKYFDWDRTAEIIGKSIGIIK